MRDRKCGVLMPISSLPSNYGIGAFSKEAYEFVDFLKEAGQTYWQILPLGQTGYGDSPYQSFSTYAGNPYFIDIDELIKAGYLTAADVQKVDFGSNLEEIDYEKVYRGRFPLLRKAYDNSPYALQPKSQWKGAAFDSERNEFDQFIQDHKEWLPDYALFSAVKNASNGVSYIEWKDDIRLRKPEAIKKYSADLADEIRFYEFQQFLFWKEWMALKEYANKNGIKIIGDIPIYVAFDSADTWSHPELFQFDEKGYPTFVAGCPPDAFAATGQLWGNPVYNWDYHKKTGYKWWLSRIEHCFEMYDIVRIDHFRGFDEYYAIPYGNKTAEIGTWEPGPGMDLFDAMKAKLGKKEIIAEDLGFLTPSVIKLVKKTGYPGMKILQFAFDSRDSSDYLPHNYEPNSVVYTGTHDNETTRGWYNDVNKKDKAFAKKYANIHSTQSAVWDLIKLAFMSVSNTCIIPMQDYLDLGNEARLNTPSTLGGNWTWRMKPDAITEQLPKQMLEVATTYRRV